MKGIFNFSKNEDDELEGGFFAESDEGQEMYEESLEKTDGDEGVCGKYSASWIEEDGTDKNMELTVSESEDEDDLYNFEWQEDGQTRFTGRAYDFGDDELTGKYSDDL